MPGPGARGLDARAQRFVPTRIELSSAAICAVCRRISSLSARLVVAMTEAFPLPRALHAAVNGPPMSSARPRDGSVDPCAAQLRRRGAEAAAEAAVEVGQVVEPAGIGNVDDLAMAVGGAFEHGPRLL